MPTKASETVKKAQAAAYARQKRMGNRNQEPALSKLLYLIASICLVGSFSVGFDMWPSGDDAHSGYQQSASIAAFMCGLLFFGLIAAAGSALSYLKSISENTQ